MIKPWVKELKSEIKKSVEDTLDDLFYKLADKYNLKSGDVDPGWVFEYDEHIEKITDLVLIWLDTNTDGCDEDE